MAVAAAQVTPGMTLGVAIGAHPGARPTVPTPTYAKPNTIAQRATAIWVVNPLLAFEPWAGLLAYGFMWLVSCQRLNDGVVSGI